MIFFYLFFFEEFIKYILIVYYCGYEDGKKNLEVDICCLMLNIYIVKKFNKIFMDYIYFSFDFFL